MRSSFQKIGAVLIGLSDRSLDLHTTDRALTDIMRRELAEAKADTQTV